MSTKLGTLTLDLVAKIGSFIGPMQDAEKQTESSFTNMRKHVNNFGAIAIAGAAAVGAGVFAMAKEYSDAASQLEMFAFISKTTTQEFQAYAVGAQTMGIEMDGLSSQFKDFNEKLGEFITLGSGGALDFFEQIAIKTEGSAQGARKLALEMQNLSGPQALQLYVDKLEEAGVTQQQMSFYLESMASDTTNLIPLLKNGGEGFKFWADAAERAGVIMDESAIQKAGELEVQLALLELQTKGASNQFIQGLMPALVSVGDAMSQGSIETNLMAEAGETLGEVFKGVAATGMGVYAVVKMLSNAIAGLAFDAVNAKRTVDLAAEKGTWADKLPGIKFAKTAIFGATMMRAPNSGVGMAAADNLKVADDVSASINKIYSDSVNQSTAAMAKLQSSQAGVAKGSEDWVKKQNEVKKASSGVNKALAEQNRLLEQQKRDREQISKAYSSDFQNMVWDEKSEHDLVKSSGFSSADQAKYLDLVQKRFNAESAEYFKSLNLELNQYKWTEEKKLEYSYQMDREIAENDVKIADAVRESKIKFIDEEYAFKRKQAEINQGKELLQAKRLWISAGQYAQEYYALVREEILNTATYSPEMKDALIKQANINQGVEENEKREQVWGDYKSMSGLDKSPHQQDMDLLKEAREQMLITEEEYQQQRLAMQMSYGSKYGADFAGMMMGLVDSSSSAYAILGGVQKGAALFSTAMNSYTAISAAWASAPFPYNLGAVASATMETGLLQAAVSAMTPVGMAHNGIDNIPKEGTWLLDGGERVLNPNQNKDLTNYLAQAQSQSSGQSQVNLNPNFVIVNERENLGDYLFSPDGTKAFVKFFKRNRSALGV